MDTDALVHDDSSMSSSFVVLVALGLFNKLNSSFDSFCDDDDEDEEVEARRTPPLPPPSPTSLSL